MAKAIKNTQLTPDTTYFVRGRVSFSRIQRQTTDAERQRENARRQYPFDKNYTYLTIHSATVLCRDPEHPTVEEQYARECFYQSSSESNPGNNFTGTNKSSNLPRVAVIDPENSKKYNEIRLEHELANGLDVTLVMRVFKGNGNNGVSLDRVLVNEPIRYFEGKTPVDKDMEAMGITFNALPPTAPAAAKTENAPAEQSAPAQAPAQAPVTNNGNFSSYANAPAPAPAPAPAGDHPFQSFDSQPQNNGNVTFGPGNRQY